MANAYAIQDDNRNPALIAHSGTTNSAETRRLTSANTDGALDVHILGTSVAVGGGGGTNVNVVTGTQQTLGTIGTVIGIGTITGLTTGTNVNTVTGTLNLVSPGTATTNLGKAAANAVGTTDVGVAAMVAQTATLGTAGSVADSQYFVMRTDANGALWTNQGYKLDSTNDSVTAVFPSGTVSLVSVLNSGSVRMTVGTVTTGTLQNLVSGTITAGTFQQTYPSFSYYSGAATTTIKSAAGVLHTLVVGSLVGAGTLFNSAGTSTAVIWSTITPPVASYPFNLNFGSLTFAGTGAGNVTIVYA